MDGPFRHDAVTASAELCYALGTAGCTTTPPLSRPGRPKASKRQCVDPGASLVTRVGEFPPRVAPAAVSTCRHALGCRSALRSLCPCWVRVHHLAGMPSATHRFPNPMSPGLVFPMTRKPGRSSIAGHVRSRQIVACPAHISDESYIPCYRGDTQRGELPVGRGLCIKGNP